VERIELTTLEGPVDALVASPEGSGPWPGVVIVHDMVSATSGGLPGIIDRVADAGHVVIAPNLYSRGGPLRCVTRVVTELRRLRGRAFDDVRAARDRLIADPRCNGKVGILGFCMGGGFALVMATDGFDAAAPFYPSFPADRYAEILDGACPVVASFGRRDPVLPGAGQRLETGLAERGITHDVKTYDDVGHSFANPYPAATLLRIAGFGYDEASANDAWARVLTFFNEHLQ
jgi:carboxymethylenebutenolidase